MTSWGRGRPPVRGYRFCEVLWREHGVRQQRGGEIGTSRTSELSSSVYPRVVVSRGGWDWFSPYPRAVVIAVTPSCRQRAVLPMPGARSLACALVTIFFSCSNAEKKNKSTVDGLSLPFIGGYEV